MDRDRDAGAIGGGEYGKLLVRIAGAFNPAADVFAEAQRQAGGLADPIVKFAVFLPQAKFAGADVAVHALRSGADAGQFVIVDGPRSVHGDVVDAAALREVDDVAVHAGAD